MHKFILGCLLILAVSLPNGVSSIELVPSEERIKGNSFSLQSTVLESERYIDISSRIVSI